MKNEIRILFVEDVPADVVILNHALRQGQLPFRLKHVDKKEAFLRELERDPPDVILSDHGLPSFDGFTALAIARDRRPDIPFIFVTDSLGEEMAIETFESGATDYVLKKNLSKLVPVIERALRESRERTALKEKERDLRETEERFRMLMEGVKDYAIFMLDAAGRITSWNAGAQYMLGYSAEEITKQHFSRFFTREDNERHKPEADLNRACAEGRFEEESMRVRKGGGVFRAHVVVSSLRNEQGELRGFAQVTRDITAQKLAEEALHKSEERYRSLVELCPDALLVQSGERIVFANSAAVHLLGGEHPEQLLGRQLKEIVHPDSWEPLQDRLHQLRADRAAAAKGPRGKARRLKEEGWATSSIEGQFIRPDGTVVDIQLAAAPLTFQDRPAVQIIARDMTHRMRAIAELRQSEARLAAILESALDAIISVNREGKVQEWNPAAQRIFGYSRAEALGHSVDQLIVPSTLQQVYSDGGLTQYLLTGVGALINRPVELILHRADASEFPAELSITLVTPEEPTGCTMLVRDITQRKQTEAALMRSDQRLSEMIEHVRDYAIYMLDAKGRVASWNSGAERLLGYTAAEIMGKGFGTFFTSEDVQHGIPDQTLRRAAEEGRSLEEGWRVRKDGTRIWIQGTLTALRDEQGQLRGFTKVARDMTAEQEAREEIRRLNEELEQRVRERTAQLEAANQELEAFSYSVSHDLRAPLRHIAGYVEIMQRESTKLDEGGKHHLETIAGSARQMGRLIDALLAFSRMGRAEMHQQRVNLTRLIDEARNELAEEMQGREIEWKIGPLPATRGDPFMLRQVLINLLSNAIKYTRPRPRAVIEIGGEDQKLETIFHVRDNGVGFDMKYATKLFGVFERLHPATEFEGSGIGLANVRRIIHRHGGRTWAEGVFNVGATFYFSLPKAAKGTV